MHASSPVTTSTKEVGKGTGLGLSLTRRAVERKGGHVGIESAPGRRGTTVTLWFPSTVADLAISSTSEGAP